MKRTSRRGKAADTQLEPDAPHTQEQLEMEQRINILILVVLLIMLLAVIIIPGSWFNAASMWCRDHIPGF